jgi:hypothetical protein
MNAFHTRILALLVVAAGAAHATQTPPAPPSAATPPTPESPPAPPTPSIPSADQGREQLQLQRELQRAQEELNRAAREVAELSLKMHEDSWSQFGRDLDRGPEHGAVLGINIGPSSHGRRDESTEAGVRILSVSPGGPADQAGLKANDVILSVAGKELKGDKDKNLSPAQQLQAQLRRTEPGNSIDIEYRRDDTVAKAKVTPTSQQDIFSIRIADSVKNDLKGLRALNGAIEVHAFNGGLWMDSQTGFGSAELVDLSPGLGRYFGTDKGLLVVRAPKDERLRLQDGDVILDIDGRIPGNPSKAYEILSSYDSGETLKLHVMRQQKRLELSIEIPEDGHAEPSRLRPEGFQEFEIVSPHRAADL